VTRDPRIDPSARVGSGIDAVIRRFCETIERASGVDLMTTEIVRLRCAQYHDCRACSSFRNAAALSSGLDEGLVAKIRDFENSGLPERWKVALRLVDAVIVAPAGADAKLARDLHENFSDAEIAEIIFDVMKWSDQKVDVSLGTDAAPWAGLSVHTFDADGRMVSHGPLSPVTAPSPS
jgi:hypothetical protein